VFIKKLVERRVIKWLSNAAYAPVSVGTFVEGRRPMTVVEYQGTTRRVVPTANVPTLRYQSFEYDQHGDFLPLYELGYEPLFFHIFEEEGLHPRIRDAMKKTWVPWPSEALLAPDELISMRKLVWPPKGS